MRIVSNTADRVSDHSPRSTNKRIHDEAQKRVVDLAHDPDAIRQRLAQLDKEWDIERCLETGSATLTLTGLALGTVVDRRWLVLSAMVQVFFIQHAIQGWCPPVPVFRSLGVRTQREIEAERHALKALLGDYSGAGSPRASQKNGTARRIFETAMH
jgi:hypothetical protein